MTTWKITWYDANDRIVSTRDEMPSQEEAEKYGNSKVGLFGNVRFTVVEVVQ